MASLGRKSKERPKPVMNVTPLVDVVLVLLIIFMIVIPAMQQGMNIEIPTMLNTDEDRDGPDPTLSVTRWNRSLSWSRFLVRLWSKDYETPIREIRAASWLSAETEQFVTSRRESYGHCTSHWLSRSEYPGRTPTEHTPRGELRLWEWRLALEKKKGS